MQRLRVRSLHHREHIKKLRRLQRSGQACVARWATILLLSHQGRSVQEIAAGMGLHAGWVWVMLVAHDLSQPVRNAPLSFLLSRFDGFIGWLVLAWTLVLGVALSLFYGRRTLAKTHAGGADVAALR